MDENRKIYVVIGAFLLITAMVSYYVIKSGQEDAYTALYFSNPIEPLIYSESEKIIKVNFLIENHEGRDSSYAYVVVLDDREVIRKDATVKNSEIISISEDISIGEVREGPVVSVQLYKEGLDGIYRQIWAELNI
jgi:hypothetical protein